MFFSLTASLVFAVSLFVCLLLNFNGTKMEMKLISARCLLLVFLLSLIYIIFSLAGFINQQSDIVNELAVAASMNLYAGIFCIAVRVWMWAAPVKERGDDENKPAPHPVLRMPERYFSHDAETKRIRVVGRR